MELVLSSTLAKGSSLRFKIHCVKSGITPTSVTIWFLIFAGYASACVATTGLLKPANTFFKLASWSPVPAIEDFLLPCLKPNCMMRSSK